MHNGTTLTMLACLLAPLAGRSGENLFPSGGVSIDLSNCQYSKALGDSERLDAEIFSQIKNSRFLESGKDWESKDVKFTSGEARLKTGSELKASGIIPELAGNTRYEALIELQGTGALEITLGTLDSKKEYTRPTKRKKFMLTGKKQTIRYQVVAFPKTTELTLSLRQVSGKSTVTRADIISMNSLKWISVRCMPAAITDNLFCVQENNPIPMSFQYRTARQGKKNVPEFMDLVLKYPEGFFFRPGQNINKVSEENENGVKTARFRFQRKTIPGGYNFNHTCNLLIGTTLKASDKIYPLSYHLEYSGVKTEPYPLNLKVLPALSAASPKFFRTGFQSVSDCYFSCGKGVEELAESIRKTGFNLVNHNSHENARDLAHALTRSGISTSISDYFFIDGYILGFGQASMQEEVKFIGKNGKPIKFNSWHCYLCPVAAYTRSDFFNRNFLEYLGNKITKNKFTPFFLPNWEPFMFDDKGCFCPRCREEFIRYSGLPQEMVLKGWPNEMTGKYRKIWVKFRSWQHAKVIGAILDGMRELSRKYHREFIFCPEIGVGDLFGNRFYEQYTVRDYINKLDWLDPWGPYIFHNASMPYRYNIGTNYGVYRTGKLVKERVKELCRDGKTPHLLALPHAYQCTTWVTEPEAMAYETAAYFINRWAASELYLFTGLDARYWQAMGKLNNAIAQVDQFVFQGEKMTSATMTQESPYPHPMAVYDGNNPTLAKDAEAIRKESLVTLDAFKLQDRVMVALGNAWQRGEAFVKVSIPGLKTGEKYAVSIPGRKVTLSTDYTAAELAKGILLHVGALRFCFYVIEPVKPGRDYGKITGRGALEKLLKDRLPEIRKKYAEDRAYAAEFVQVPSYDFAQSPMLNAGTVTLKPKRNLNDSTLSVKTPYYSCDLDMGHGGGISNYIVKGKIRVDSKAALLRDGFVTPSLIVQRPYEFSGWEAVDDGAAVTLKYKMGAKDIAELKGLTLTKRYIFGEKTIILDEEMKNESSHPIVFSYRSHNIPSLFGRNGSMRFAGGESLKRTVKPLFHPVKGYTGTCFEAETGSVCTGTSAVFTGNNCNLKITWEIPHFIGAYRWDTANSSVSSFELVTDQITLQPGQNVFFKITLQ